MARRHHQVRAGSRISAQIVFGENDVFLIQYREINRSVPAEAGASAVVGIENPGGTAGIPYSLRRPQLSDEVAVQLRLPGTAIARGVVRDANTGEGLYRASVSTRGRGRCVGSKGPRLFVSDWSLSPAVATLLLADLGLSVPQPFEPSVPYTTVSGRERLQGEHGGRRGPAADRGGVRGGARRGHGAGSGGRQTADRACVLGAAAVLVTQDDRGWRFARCKATALFWGLAAMTPDTPAAGGVPVTSPATVAPTTWPTTMTATRWPSVRCGARVS
ncbi:hypothetical protein [Kibdelosporangium phytohabitans]|uniref:Uncharacterized protein n=1 Tax=Kibdelosporangium phytohabitans TaxID=860235 RepID=A0A0N9HQG5_9PSEU|nr:hypothetical protein [Kibdelosporangium phytohabitans]ALG06958.1 hypothetical protein AOZ06_08495 [Kibdelosporangium phytohabitans]MBE1468237.1 hypothetical protein [Kibdelosporangium phytohabitans]